MGWGIWFKVQQKKNRIQECKACRACFSDGVFCLLWISPEGRQGSIKYGCLSTLGTHFTACFLLVSLYPPKWSQVFYQPVSSKKGSAILSSKHFELDIRALRYRKYIEKDAALERRFQQATAFEEGGAWKWGHIKTKTVRFHGLLYFFYFLSYL